MYTVFCIKKIKFNPAFVKLYWGEVSLVGATKVFACKKSLSHRIFPFKCNELSFNFSIFFSLS